MEVLSLVEYQRLDLDSMESSVAERLRDDYGTIIGVKSPFDNHGKWGLTSQGWVGFLPVTADFGLSLEPKVPLVSLFRMLETAYRLDGLRLFDSLFDSEGLDEIFERLATILARRVLDRTRKGLFGAYVSRDEPLQYLRGRLDLVDHTRSPWRVGIRCRFEEHTPDLADNQILLWTLLRIARSGICRGEGRPWVRSACRALSGLVTLSPYAAADASGRLYHRLNADYEPLHALCRFFLDNMGPTHELGDRKMLPFLIDMAKLFESFVAEWLKAHLPSHLEVAFQENLALGSSGQVTFRVDLVLRDSETKRILAVLDTKYKDNSEPLPADVQQVLAYAATCNCRHAFLVYPRELGTPFSAEVRHHSVAALGFPLDGDLEVDGQLWLSRLLARLEPETAQALDG